MAGAGEKAEAYKVKLGTSTIYPQTVSDAVVDTGSNQTLTESLKSIKKAADEAKNWSVKLQTYDSYDGIQTAVDVNKITPSSTFFLDGRYFANIATAVTVSTHTVGFPVAVNSIEQNGVFNRIVFGTGLHGTAISDPLGSAIGIYCNPQINFAIGSIIATSVYGTMPILSSQFGKVISKDSIGFNSNQFYLDALDTGGVRLNVGLPVLHISSDITYLPSEVNPILRGLKIGTGLTYEIRRPESEEEKFKGRMFDDADGGIVEIALSDQNVKQDKTDNKLKTTSKDIVGAINEVKSSADSKQDKLKSYIEYDAAFSPSVGSQAFMVAENVGFITAAEDGTDAYTITGRKGKAYYGDMRTENEIAKKSDIPTSLPANGGTADFAKCPEGFTHDTVQYWGDQTGFFITRWNDATGGSIAFRGDNPTAGNCSMIIDGTIYVEGGKNEVAVKKDINAMQATVNSLQSTIAALTNRVAALEKAATTTTTTTTVPPRTSTTTAGATGTPRAKANNWDEEDSDTSSLNKSVDDYINGETV